MLVTHKYQKIQAFRPTAAPNASAQAHVTLVASTQVHVTLLACMQHKHKELFN